MITPAPATDLPRPPRHIALLSDGTGNSRGKAEQTNVWRVYEALDLRDPSDLGTPRQFAFYDDGVGSSSFKPAALLGGALGLGLARNVQELYAFLCRMYRPGDRIYAFGFSRGSFTIRVLVGLIDSQGLVRYRGNEAELARLVTRAYRAYRRRYRTRLVNWIAVPRWMRDQAVDLWSRLRGLDTYSAVQADPARCNLRWAAGETPIAFLGLWDTVDAYGMPVDELGAFFNAFVWPFRMPNATLCPLVARAVHALALDDERNTFHPRLWNEDARIRQVWFAGMHSDVGGGYPDKGLAHVSLKWIVGEAQDSLLRFVASKLAEQEALGDENGPMNDSRRGLAGYYRYNPRRLVTLIKPRGIERPLIHESVLRRIRAGQDAYAPLVLPPEFDVLPLAGGSPINGAAYVEPAKRAHFAAGLERAFNGVWRKRMLYFATLGFTLALLLLPLVTSDTADACVTALCALSPLIRGLDAVLPAAMAAWTAWYAAHPGAVLLLGPPIALGLWLGSVTQTAIFDATRRVWYSMLATTPDTVAQKPEPLPLTGAERRLWRVRESAPYRRAFGLLRRWMLPGVSGVLVLLAMAVLANNFLFAIDASRGYVCRATANTKPVTTAPAVFQLHAGELCLPTGLELKRGGTYELTLRIDEAFSDNGLAADLRGVETPSLAMRLGTLTKREPGQPYLHPMLRVGDKGADVMPIKPEPSIPRSDTLHSLRTLFVARSSGELFVYVNDSIGPPGARHVFQTNNCGVANATIRLFEAGALPASAPALSAQFAPPARCN